MQIQAQINFIDYFERNDIFEKMIYHVFVIPRHLHHCHPAVFSVLKNDILP
jgi:hypothetical protein